MKIVRMIMVLVSMVSDHKDGNAVDSCLRW